MSFSETELEIYINESIKYQDEIQNAVDTFTFIYLSIAPLIIMGNTIVVCATVVSSQMRSPYHYFIVSIASADILVGLLTVPVYCVGTNSKLGGNIYDLHHTSRTFVGCMGLLATLGFPQFVNLFCFLLLSIERSLAVNYPLRYRTILTQTRLKLVVLGTWCCALLMSIPSLTLMGNADNSETKKTSCNPYLVQREWFMFLKDSLIVGLCILVPFFVNLQIFFIVRRQWRKESCVAHLVPAKMRSKLRERRRMSLVVFALIYLYIILWIPYFAIMPIQFTAFHPYTFEVTKHAVLLACFVNSITHAPLFTFIKEEYRHAYIQLFHLAPWNWHKLRHRRHRGPFGSKGAKSKTGISDAIDPVMNPIDAILHINHSSRLYVPAPPDLMTAYRFSLSRKYILREGTSADALGTTQL